MRHAEPDVVIVGAGIAGGTLGTVLARAGFQVALLERENSYPDRVRGEFMAPWGVTELNNLELLQSLREAGALFTGRSIPYDENFAPAEHRLLQRQRQARRATPRRQDSGTSP